MWNCRCDCGRAAVVWSANLKNALTRSCGCLRAEIVGAAAKARMTKHGMWQTPEFRIWTGIVTRCSNPNSEQWKKYGKRGITMCDRWKSFAAFYEDMGPRPSAVHSIDRRDNDKGYEPSNCRWATPIEQAANRRRAVAITHDGVRMSLPTLARVSGIALSTLEWRHRRGWSSERLTEKPHPRSQRGRKNITSRA
jgi:hypothetical protein